MTSTLMFNASHARKNLYSLIDKVSEEGATVVIYKEGTNKKVLLTSVPQQSFPVEDQLHIVASTRGAIRTRGYNKDEFREAREQMKVVYKKKYGHD